MCHFASTVLEDVIDPFQFVHWARVILFQRIRMKPNTVSLNTVRRLFIYVQQGDKPPFRLKILAESAHQLVNCLRHMKSPLLGNHHVHHVIFSHVLDTWNIDAKVSRIGACYYRAYGKVHGPTFGDIKMNTLKNIIEANTLIKSEQETPSCLELLLKNRGVHDTTDVAKVVVAAVVTEAPQDEEVKDDV